MEETLRGDQRSVHLVFEADRQAAELLSKIYQRLLASSDAKTPEWGSEHSWETVDSGQPALAEVGS